MGGGRGAGAGGGGGCDDCSGPGEAEESAGTSLRFRGFHRDVAAQSARRRVSQSNHQNGDLRKDLSVLPPDHGGVLLDGRLQQPLQNGPFPHGDGEVTTPSGPTSGEGCFSPQVVDLRPLRLLRTLLPSCRSQAQTPPAALRLLLF